MEHVSCNVIYADRQVQRDRCVAAARVVDEEWESDLVARNVCLLLEIFGEGMTMGRCWDSRSWDSS